MLKVVRLLFTSNNYCGIIKFCLNEIHLPKDLSLLDPDLDQEIIGFQSKKSGTFNLFSVGLYLSNDMGCFT